MAKRTIIKFTPLELVINPEHPGLEKQFKNNEFLNTLYKQVTDEFVKIPKINKKFTKVTLFNVNNLGLSVSVNKEQFSKIIDHIIVHYTKLEDYKKCAELIKLKGKL